MHGIIKIKSEGRHGNMLTYKNWDEKVQTKLNSERKDFMNVIRWAFDEYDDKLIYACSFGAEGVVLLDLIAKNNPHAKIVFRVWAPPKPAPIHPNIMSPFQAQKSGPCSVMVKCHQSSSAGRKLPVPLLPACRKSRYQERGDKHDPAEHHLASGIHYEDGPPEIKWS